MQISIRHSRITAFAFTALLAGSALAVLAPTAEAYHGCTPHVGADGAHNPVGSWANHGHPLFTWYAYSCSVVRYGVSTSWGGYYETTATSTHPTLPDGAHSVSVRTLYAYTYTWTHWHCSWSCYPHTHYETRYYWTGFVNSGTVYVDTTAPAVSANVGSPSVADGDLFVTSSTPFTLAASDASSGVKSVEYKLDDGAWSTYGGAFTLAGEDGAHVLAYRATDNVNLETSKTIAFILDNSAPEMSVLHPTPNSANVDDVSAESCTENPRVTMAGETVVEAAAPAMPEVPEEVPAAPETPQEIEDVLAEIPQAPEVVTGTPDACAGEVLETAGLTATVPGAPTVDDSMLPPEAQEAIAALPPMPGAPQVPAEVQDALDQAPEAPAAPDELVVDAQDVEFTPVIFVTGVVDFSVDVQDALAGTANVQFLADGELLDSQHGPNGVYSYAWNSTAVTAGEHSFTIKATDRLGNEDSITFTVIVTPQSPAGVEGTIAEAQADAEAAVDDAASQLPEAPEAPELPA